MFLSSQSRIFVVSNISNISKGGGASQNKRNTTFHLIYINIIIYKKKFSSIFAKLKPPTGKMYKALLFYICIYFWDIS